MGAPFPLPSELGVEIPSWQEQTIMDGLDLYVQKRIQNMDELWTRLYVQPQPEAPVSPAVGSEGTQPPVPEHTNAVTSSAQQHTGGKSPEGPLSWENRMLMGMQRIRSICSDIYHKMKEL